MATPFATNADVKARWPSFPAGSEAYADTLCTDASDMIRERWPDVDARILAGTLEATTLKRIVCAMVKRAMLNGETEGVKSFTSTTGPFGDTREYTNPDGNLYFTNAEERVLDGQGSRRAFAVDLSPGVRPDWMDC